jgi:hypothetical protein
LELIEGQAQAEAGRSRLRVHAEAAAVFADDAHGVVESQTAVAAERPGGAKRLEDAFLNFRRNAGA